jgi:hypothetical protein
VRAGVSALTLIAVTWVGCAGSPERPPPVSGAPKEVTDVVKALERATDAKDFNTVCFDLFSDQVRAQAGGVRCPALLRRTARDVEAPRIRVESIRLQGDAASVRVRTESRDQPPVPDVIELVRQRGRYRISSLGR